uniref:Galectin n=1 Tax=Timema poppense TaxID=170557 RepID=A0A7R9D337_TIMPO|nr:unnamed protein product [Timema poppensis]
MLVSKTPFSVTNGNIPFTLALDVAHNRPVPFHLPLVNGFVPGYEVVVVGQVQHGADRFHINLESSTQDVIFHFNPRFHDGVIVRNSKFNGAWGAEERGGGLQMRPGQEFRINIVAEHDGYRVYVNGAFFTLYKHRQGNSLVHQLLIDGNVSIRQLVYYSTLLGIGYPLRSDCNIALQHSLPPGSEITLVGTPQPHLDRFSVNLESAGGAEKALHFNPRFNDGVVVRNSFLNGGWGPEERDGGLPLRKGAKFTLNIRCDPDGYRITVNGRFFTLFRHRQSSHMVTNLTVKESVIINSVSYKSQISSKKDNVLDQQGIYYVVHEDKERVHGGGEVKKVDSTTLKTSEWRSNDPFAQKIYSRE